MKVRNCVKEVRRGMRYSRRLLAKETGVAPRVLQLIEADNGYEPRLNIVRRISETLGRTDLFWLEAGEQPAGHPTTA